MIRQKESDKSFEEYLDESVIPSTDPIAGSVIEISIILVPPPNVQAPGLRLARPPSSSW